MQVVLDRAEMEAGRENTNRQLECLQQLPGFKARSPKELMRMLIDHDVTVRTALPQQTLIPAGTSMQQVLSASILRRHCIRFQAFCSLV